MEAFVRDELEAVAVVLVNLIGGTGGHIYNAVIYALGLKETLLEPSRKLGARLSRR